MAGPSTSNLAVGVVNLVDALATTLTMGNPDAGHPGGNLQLTDIGLVARTVNDTSGSITIDLGGNFVLGPFALALVKHNLPPAATVALAFKTGAAGGGTTALSVSAVRADAYGYFAGKIDDQYRNTWLYYQNAMTPVFRSVVATFAGGGTAEGYYEVARAFLGDVVLPLYGFAHGGSPGAWAPDPSERQEMSGGNMVHRRRRKYRRVVAEMRNLSESEAYDDVGATLDALAGKVGDCLVIPFPPDAFPALAGRLQQRVLWGPQEDIGETSNPVFSTWIRTLSFRERT